MRLEDLIARKFGGPAGAAEEIGVTRQAVGHIVRGRKPSSTMRYALAKACGVDPDMVDWPHEREAEKEAA